MSAPTDPAVNPGVDTPRGPGRLVGVLEVLVVAALCAVPAVGPETWLGAVDGGPLALVARSGGVAGLALLHAAAVAVVAVLVRTTLRDLADPLRRLVALVVALVGLAAVPVGPRLLGLVLAAGCLLLWRRAQRPGPVEDDGHDRVGLLALPVLVGLWAALDPGWVLGPALGAVALAGSALGRRDPVGTAGERPPLRHPALAVAGSLLSGLLVSALRLATSGGAWGGPGVVAHGWLEDLWAGPVAGGSGPPALTAPLTLLVLLPLLLLVGHWLTVGRPSWQSVCWAGAAALLAVGPAGTAPTAGIVAAPVLAEALGALPGTRAASRGRRTTAFVPLVALLLGGPVAVAATSSAAAADPVTGLRSALQALPTGTAVLADPRFGPRARLGTGADVVRVPDDDLLTALRAEPGWREVVRDSGSRVALLTDEAPLLAALQERLGWRVVARSGPLVLVRASG